MKKLLFISIFSIFITLNLFSQEDVISNATIVNEIDTIITVQENSTWVEKVVVWYMDNLNYFTITLLMTIESSFLPFPSEVVVPPAAYAACDPNNALYITESKIVNISVVVLFSTIGALIGAYINFFLALYLGRPIIYKFADSKLGHLCLLDSDKVKHAEEYFIKHGRSSTFIGRLVPAVRQLISIPAGLAKMKLSTFTLYTCLGAGLWNIILAILGYFAHGQQDLINQYSSELSYVLLILGVLFVVYLVWKGIKSKKKKQKMQNTEKLSL